MPTPIDAATYAALQQQRAGAGLPPAKADDYTIVTPPPPAPQVDEAPAEQPAAGWDVAAFDALPEQTRAAVRAGMAETLGRTTLESEARGFLARPGDVHHHLTDPSRYVTEDGAIDRDAMHADLRDLAARRPELSCHAHVSTERHAPVGIGGGAPAGASEAARVGAVLDQMRDATGLR